MNRREFFGNAAKVAVVGAMATGATKLFAQGSGTTKLVEKGPSTKVNRAKDPKRMTAMEKKHVPQIHIPAKVRAGQPVDVTVKVAHVMYPEHHINWIDLYADDIQISRVSLTPEFMQAQVTVTLTLSKSVKLRALDSCNLHGVWENTVNVQVS